jgi:CTP:molybdopterin cytidylyltransferase MocA
MSRPIPAIVLAGSRPGPDPLLTGTGVSTKALLPIAGQAMLVHVVKALRGSPLVGSITILAQNSAELAAIPGLAGLTDLHFADSGQGINSSLAAALPTGDDPLLVTTADNVLLTP